MFNPASLLEQAVLNILAMLELYGYNERTWFYIDYKPSTFIAHSRINTCFFNILKYKKAVRTRCVPCGFSDEASSSISDCFHYPFGHKLTPTKTHVPFDFFLTGELSNTNATMTPILVTDGRTGRLPSSILQIGGPGIGLREVIRKIYKVLLLTTFQPGPLVVISAGVADLKCNAKQLYTWENELERNRKTFFNEYFQPLEELIHFTRSLNGEVVISTLIPNPPDHDPGCGYATTSRGKTIARKLFFEINHEILKRNRNSLWKGKGLLNPAKYFYGKPSRKIINKQDELGKPISLYKINRNAFRQNRSSPTLKANYYTNFLLVSTALKIAGWGRLSHNGYDTLLRQCNLGKLTKTKVLKK